MMPLKLVEIVDDRLKCLKKNNRIFTSLEGENPGGSIKDRMVLGELQSLLSKGQLHSSDKIVELSAGSTARALAYYCRKLDLKCQLYVPDSLPEEVQEELQLLGAELRKVELQSAFEIYESETDEELRFNQFFNKELRRHFEKMWISLENLLNPHVLIGSIGTGSSLYGMAEASKRKLKILSAEPSTKHMISGVRNLGLESFGEKEVCDSSLPERIIVSPDQVFPDSVIQSSDGLIQVTPSFQMVLGALEVAMRESVGQRVFAIGAANYRLVQSEILERS